MPVWYEQTNVAHRLSHPFVYPGGPSVVAEPIAARRQRCATTPGLLLAEPLLHQPQSLMLLFLVTCSVQQFQDQATAAWADLLTTVNEGLQQQQQVGGHVL